MDFLSKNAHKVFESKPQTPRVCFCAAKAASHFLLAFIEDVRTFLSNDTDENVIRTVANVRALKKRFEGDDLKQAA